MLNKIIEFSIKNKLIIILFTLGLIIYGIFEVKKLPIDAVPDITDNQVQIITVSPSLGAPDVERFITFPLEQANNNIAGIKQMRSFSRFGLSVITIVFNDNVDLHLARQQVAERLQQVSKDIPQSLGTPTMAPISTGLGEIYQYTIRPKIGYEHRYNAMQLRTIQDWVVRRQLLGTEGVADVASFGGDLKQYEVAINPATLKSMGVTMNEVFDALQKNNQNTGGAYIEKGPSVLFIRTEGLMGKIPEEEGKDLIEKSSCLTCHKEDGKLIGPSYKEIAAKYTEADIDKLADKIIAGGSGVWGETAMTPHPGMDKENAKKMVKYILTLKK